MRARAILLVFVEPTAPDADSTERFVVLRVGTSLVWGEDLAVRPAEEARVSVGGV